MQNVKSQVAEDQVYLSPGLAGNPLYPNNSKSNKMAVKINIPSLSKYLMIVIGLLVVLNILVVISYQLGIEFPARDKFYFDREDSLPTYYSALLLFGSALVLSIIAFLKRKEKDSFAVHWTILSFIFLALSIDEAVSFHEYLIEPLRANFQLDGALRFPWVIAGGLFVLVFVFSYLKFFLALSKNMKILFFMSGAIYVLGVIGFEMIGGSIYKGSTGVSDKSLLYMVVMTTEETLEMLGISLFIITLLKYIKSYTPKLKLYFD